MAVYIPASRRRRLAVITTGLAVLVGLGIGFVAGRATAKGVDDAVAESRHRASEAAAGLSRLPIEYEQTVTGTGGEDTAKMVASIEAARSLLDDAYDSAPWLSTAAKRKLNDAVDTVLADVRNSVSPATFKDDVDAAANAIDETFNTAGGRAG